MRADLLTMYVVMAVWSILGAAARLVLQITGSQPLDPLPFIAVLLGIAALIAVFARVGPAGLAVAYTILATWLVVGPVLRFVLAATAGRPVDVIPFITATIGTAALVLRFAPRPRTS